MVSQTNTFPVDTMLIDSSINDGNWNFDYTSYYDAKGFQALDYLLNKKGKSDTEISQDFATSENKKLYIKDISSDLLNNINYVFTLIYIYYFIFIRWYIVRKGLIWCKERNK